jgi:hypothetical protein
MHIYMLYEIDVHMCAMYVSIYVHVCAYVKKLLCIYMSM